MSQVAALFRNQIAKMHDGRIVNPYSTSATSSGKESLEPTVKEPKSKAPKANRPQIDPMPIIVLVLSRMVASLNSAEFDGLI